MEWRTVADTPRLLYLDDIPTPYRLDVQRRVAELWPGAFRIVFCAAGEPGREWDIDLSGLDTTVLAGRQWRPVGQSNPFSFKWNPDIIKELASFEPDVVILSGYAHPTMQRAARWCQRSLIPYGMTCETSFRNSACSGLRWRVKRHFAAWLVRGMAFGLPVGREAAAYLRHLGPSNAPMYLFPNTPDTTLFRETAERINASCSDVSIRTAFGLDSEAAIFLFVGRLIKAKRPLDAIRAFNGMSSVRDAQLVIVGDGPLRKQLEAASSGKAGIHFTGWMHDRKRLAELMAIATALLLPSMHEPWGAVVNEAMASGTPVISSDRVGAAAELVEADVDGFIASVGDVATMAKVMARLVDAPALAVQMGRAAQAKAIANGEKFAARNLVNGALTAHKVHGSSRVLSDSR
jgi:glycosyltransferase involved in cell wall biosynthesis